MSTSAEQNNEEMKEIVVTGLGLIPEVGGILSALATLWWPKSDPVDPLKELQDYVKDMMNEVVGDVVVMNIKDYFTTLQDKIVILRDAETGEKTALATKDVYDETDELITQFKNHNDTQPWNTLTYLVLFGTFRLQANRYIVQWYDKYFQHNTAQSRELKGLLQHARYLIMQRRNVITRTHVPAQAGTAGPMPGVFGNPNPSKADYWIVADAATQWHQEFSDENLADIAWNNRYFDVFTASNGFQSQLDQLVDAYRYWDFFDDDTPYNPVPKPFFTYNRMGDGLDGGETFNHMDFYNNHGPMTRLDFYWDAGALKGFQVWYGGVDSGFVGMRTADGSTCTFEDAVISMIGGRANQWVERFYYNTSKRQAQGEFVMGPNPVSGDFAWQQEYHAPAQPGDNRVAYFSGINARSPGRITQLNVAWVKTTPQTSVLGREFIISGPRIV
jgi:hypothetical protein